MSRSAAIAVLSTACRLPDASSPAELWDNVIEGRRSFRAIPRQRLDLGRYAVGAVGEAESITPIRAGLLTNWQVLPQHFRVPNKTFLATDLTHWLALDLALESIGAIGGPDRLNRSRTAVIVANTLTGEFSRAALLRVRLPFLDEVLAKASDKENMPPELAARLRNAFAAELRQRFPEPNEESLAGGLANTIAGRIANYFDLGGGAYVIDGACASSLVAVADAANLLLAEQADAVIVAAVDLSLDPFELVGFSRNGALAAEQMRVFDARSNGFWPGEGGACLLLMREDDAAQRGMPIMARLRGWGLSSDGAGGLTRPSTDGQLAAYRRAYDMAAVDPADLTFVEAHGTGTAVGDPVEVRALARLRDGAKSSLPVGSIKANIGHTKAAAGLAGMVKAVEALRRGIIPPHVSCERPHPVFAEVDNKIRPISASEAMGEGEGALAGVSSFGFGGINAHVVLERAGAATRAHVSPRSLPAQDAELFLFSGDDAADVCSALTAIEARAATLSMAELVDAAAYAARSLKPGSVRVAVVASSGSELVERLACGRAAVLAGASQSSGTGVFVGRPSRPPRIGFLFPGQGASYQPDGGIWRHRFAAASALIKRLPAVEGRDLSDTAVAQPGILAASLAALDILERLGICATIAAGHSLGEIAALAWAGALDFDTALDLAKTRGSLMAKLGAPRGGMLRVALSARDAESVSRECGVAIACCNGTSETVFSGPVDAIRSAAVFCRARHIDASRLAVSHAFHSPGMAAAAGAFAKVLGTVRFGRVAKPVASTISGEVLTPQADLRKLLIAQITQPVLFNSALGHVAAASDFIVEVGSGSGLTRLARANGLTSLPIDAFGDSLKPLLLAVGALFAAGIDIRADALFRDRAVRSFSPDVVPRFIASPCGSPEAKDRRSQELLAPPASTPPLADLPTPGSDPLAAVLNALAKETGLAREIIGADDHFLDALHLNSLAVTRIVTAATQILGMRMPRMPTDFANATARQLAATLAELRTFADATSDVEQRVAGVRPWLRTYAMKWSRARERPGSDAAILWSRITVDQQIPGAGTSTRAQGLLIWLEGQCTPVVAERLVFLAADAARNRFGHLALCHHGAPVASFARSIAKEAYFRSVRVIDGAHFNSHDPRLTAALSAEVRGYYEVRLSGDGSVEEPTFVPQRVHAASLAAIGAEDVVAIVGGGKGIGAECALQIANRGATIILIGRSAADEPAVAAALARIEQKCTRCRYLRCDVLDTKKLAAGLAAIGETYGPITTLIYAAGVNEPKRLIDLELDSVRQTIALKTTGLQTTLAALPGLRRLVTFGSLIGRIGLEGEAHYALANAMQSAATEAWGDAAPGRAALAIEWSVWGGLGMGEQLGTIERLSAQGVDPISTDAALAAFDQLIARNAVGVIAVTSRFGPPADLSLGSVELPMLRFIDEPKVHFPGVELVVETVLSKARDPYLDDHVVFGRAVLPVVLGLEAMAQVASALAPLGPQINVRNLVLSRAVGIVANGATRIRIAALRNQEETTEVHLLAEDDGFQAPCMQALFDAATTDLGSVPKATASLAEFEARALYGPLFFNCGRFERLQRLGCITSRRVVAQIKPERGEKWFSAYDPDEMILWDPGATDAALHALQATTPHWRVLPVGAERIEVVPGIGPLTTISAIERRASDRFYTFDIVVSDAEGRIGQRWTNATFRAIDRIKIDDLLRASPVLAVPHLERIAREIFGDDTIEISLICDAHGSRESRRNAAIERLGLTGAIDRRGDGRPIRSGGGSVSIAHRGEMTLAITARKAEVSCDIEDIGNDGTETHDRRRHAVFEVCRKLGRRPSIGASLAITPGVPVHVNDLAVVVLDLPCGSGERIVAFGHSPTPLAELIPSEYEVAS